MIYTPAPGFSGRDVFSYRVKDNDGKSSNRARVAVSVRSGGGPPGANNSGPAAAAGPDQNTQSGQPVALNGSASSDPDGDPITFSWRFLSVPPISTRVDADIVNRATPAPSFTPDVDGAYSVELTVSDGALSDTDSVLITAATDNVAPNTDAGPDQNADREQVVSLDGRGSADPDNGPDPLRFTWSFAEVPADSSLVDADIADATSAQASFAPDVVGRYRLSLTASDGDLSDQDEVAITVTLPNVPPNANAGPDRVVQLGPPPQTAFLDGRLSNDPDDGPVTPLAFQWGFVSQPPGSGLVDGDITGANSKTPGFIPNVAGSYVLRLVVSDGRDTHEDHVLVKANAAPLTMPDRFSMLEDTTLRRGRPGVLDNDTDANRDHLTAVLVRPPAHAAIIPFRLLCFVFPFAHADDALPARAAIDFVPFPIGFPDFSLCGDGSFTYTPERNFTGTDSFTYRANDGSANSNVEETVTITVQATNDAPVAQDDPLPSISEDTPLEAASVLGNDSDEDRTPLTAVLVRGPSHAAFFNLNLNGTFSYTPRANFNGTDSFTYHANDGIANSNVATVTITVNPVNDDPPVVTPATFSLAENGANATIVGTVTATDPDAAQTKTFSITAGNLGGAFAINTSSGQITVASTAALNFETTPSFSLTAQVTDNGTPAQSGSATITVNLTNVNEAPAPTGGPFSIVENSANGSPVGTVAANDPDVGQAHTFTITGGNTGNAFAINSGTGAITVSASAALDFETTPSFALTVRVTDNGTPAVSGTTTVAVNLTNVVVQFGTEVQPIFAARCVSCHGGIRPPTDPATGFRPDLRAGNAHTAIFNMGPLAGSPCEGTSNYVVPRNPGGSLLVRKIEGTAGCGSRMPPPRLPPLVDMSLSSTQINTIREWIMEDALNN